MNTNDVKMLYVMTPVSSFNGHSFDDLEENHPYASGGNFLTEISGGASTLQTAKKGASLL
jgi:hypothetical protein